MNTRHSRSKQNFRKTALAALIGSMLAAPAFATNNEIVPNPVEGVTITSNNDAGANGEGIFMYDSNVLVFSADQSQATQTTTLQSADDIIINSDSDAGGVGGIALQMNGTTLMSLDSSGTAITTGVSIGGNLDMTSGAISNVTTLSASGQIASGSVATGAISASSLNAGSGAIQTSGTASAGTGTFTTLSGTTLGGNIAAAGNDVTGVDTLGATTGNITTVNSTTINNSGTTTTGALSVTNNADVGGNLAVTGTSTLNGATAINNTLTVNAGGGATELAIGTGRWT